MKAHLNIKVTSIQQLYLISFAIKDPFDNYICNDELYIASDYHFCAHFTRFEMYFSIVKSKQTFMMTIEFLPRKTGTKDLVVSFNSKELAMVEGSCEITIAE